MLQLGFGLGLGIGNGYFILVILKWQTPFSRPPGLRPGPTSINTVVCVMLPWGKEHQISQPVFELYWQEVNIWKFWPCNCVEDLRTQLAGFKNHGIPGRHFWASLLCSVFGSKRCKTSNWVGDKWVHTTHMCVIFSVGFPEGCHLGCCVTIIAYPHV